MEKVSFIGRWRGGLSARLLVLTVLFAMLAEVLIYLPSIARFRAQYLTSRLEAAHLAVLALEATPSGMVDAGLQRRLLAHAQVVGVTVHRPGTYKLMLGMDEPRHVDAVVALDRNPPLESIGDALATLLRHDERVLAVTGPSPKERAVLVDAFVEEAPLRAEMLAYSGRMLALSLFMSLATAALVYVSLHRLLVRPMRRLTAMMTRFQQAPEDQTRIIEPSRRNDEIGLAERALADMQKELRTALVNKARLAGTGAAVAKVSHDLKGLLTTAMLESDRLEAQAGEDPGQQRLTAGLVRALDRAVCLCGETLRYAGSGPPTLRPAPEALHRLVAEAAEAMPPPPEGAYAIAIAETVVVSADRAALLRVFDNLFRNAWQAGARTVRVTASQGRDSIWIEVADDGDGLPERAREHLFEAFAGSARKGGTGLGLPIARELARAHGGDLTLVASGPAGTVFGLRLLRPASGAASGIPGSGSMVL